MRFKFIMILLIVLMIKRTHNLVKLFDIKSQRTREQYSFNKVCCRVSTFLQLKLGLLGALKLGTSNEI